MADLELTFNWAADPKIRKYAFQQNEITRKEHEAWFTKKMKNPTCEYYILEVDSIGIGSIRFDIDPSQSALISYLIDPSRHGKGYGKKILQLGLQRLFNQRPETKAAYGLVMKENLPSIAIFEKLGFKKVAEDTGSYKYEKVLQVGNITVE